MHGRARRWKSLVPLFALLVAWLGLHATSVGSAAAGFGPPPASHGVAHRAVCGPVPAGYARCHAHLVVNPETRPDRRPTTTTTTTTAPTTTTTTPTTTTTTTAPTTTTTTTVTTCTNAHAGYAPCHLQSAYSLPSLAAGSGQTVAIVDAYNDPNAESDMAVYRSTYGLPTCTTANGCFRKVDQNGGTSYPNGNLGWAQEESLDLDMVSAVCPNCHILLVEATTNSFLNLFTAEDTAARLGASAISNSYGGGEFSSETFYESHYNHPGIAITASSGDNGYGVEFPASSQYVTAVGGTSLVANTSTARGWSETAWSGAGSGCSAFEPKPGWQTDAGCARRTVADVSADADPNTGVTVYDTYGSGGWLEFGGTSVASPIVASVYALAGNAATVNYGSYPYAHTGSVNDVTSGSNGSCGGYLCTAIIGYDGPTGLGTPAATGAF